MAVENINDRPRPIQPDPRQDTEIAPGAADMTEEKVEITFESVRSDLEEMLQFNYGVVGELLGQIAAVNPFRADMAQGKQPVVAAQEAADAPNAEAVAPVGSPSASSYTSGLKQVESLLANHDIQLQQMFDALALSRSGRKPDMQNHGLEYDRLQSMVNQSQERMHQTLNQLPETLPNSSGPLNSLLPEFSDKLQQYDSGFRQLLGEIRQGLLQARSRH
ncbi:MAG: hypothetical protein ACR2PT_00950 [Endozoicomonas sp.]